MQKSLKNSKYADVLHQLKNLSAEDRMVLGLYIYEGLTTKEVSQILNSKTKSPGAKKKTKNSLPRSRYTV